MRDDMAHLQVMGGLQRGDKTLRRLGVLSSR